MQLTRRDFGKITLGASLMPALQSSQPASKFAGVQVGINVPYSFRGQLPGTASDILDVCRQLGISAVELRMQPVEHVLGSPAPYPAAVARGAGAGGRGAEPPAAAPTREQLAAQRAAADELRQWRLSLPMARVREVRDKYERAGVKIDIVKVDPFDAVFDMTDEEVNYFFELARNLGARAISCELLDRSVISTKLLGTFAAAHRMPVAFHGHGQAPAVFERAMSYSPYNAINVDLGHFVAANNVSPVEFIRKYHDRIPHVHVKDRKMKGGPNMPFGQGDTPIAEVLRLIRDNRWNIMAAIEYEYPVPDGSSVLAELRRSVEYCRTCLLG
jgi:hypothetical protein